MRRCLHLTLCALWIAATAAPAAALSFGQNKLHTRDLDWRILETEHFEIFYYPEERELAVRVCAMAERAYRRNTRLLRFIPETKIPLFIYRNRVDFQQTDLIPQLIGSGTGGFTEAFKNRIALPALASERDLQALVTHEILHALQFDILYGEGLRSFRVYKGYLIPMWVMEGSAEFAAGNWDNVDDLVIRDAVIYDRLQPLDVLDGFNHLEDVYLAYQESRLAIRYLAEQFGEEAIALMFNKFKSQISVSQILRETVGLGLEAFNREFLYWVRQKYWVQTVGRQDPAVIAKPLVQPPSGRLTRAQGPVWSPDGRFLAYIADRDHVLRVYLKPRNDEGPGYPAVNRRFETLSLNGRPLSWSPDGTRLAFVGREEGRTFLYRLTVDSGQLERTALDLDDWYSPSWSPRGDRLALVGVRQGISDIYVWDPSARTLTALSRDLWADNAPVWTSDGRDVLYASEREMYWQLAAVPAEGGTPRLLTNDPWDHVTPWTVADHPQVYFSAAPHGIYNLYRMPLGGGVAEPLTDVRSGIFQPALSPDSRQAAFVTLEAGTWRMFRVDLPAEGTRPDFPAQASEVAGEVAAEPAANTRTVASASGDTSPANTLAISAESLIRSDRPYGFRFSPDLLFLLAGYDSSQGVVGGGYLTASDFLGDHLMSLYSDFVPGYQSNTQLTYVNSTYPVTVFLAAAYQRNFYRITDLETGTLLDEFNDESIGGSVGLSRPFSLFDRLEMEFRLNHLTRRYQDGGEQARRVNTLRLSMIHDSTAWYDFDPVSGTRFNLSLTHADKLLGGEARYSLVQMESQIYTPLEFIDPRLVLGARMLAAASIGEDHPYLLFGGIGILPGSATLRGYRYGELIGSQVAVVNFEFRFPLARNIHYSLWPFDFLLFKQLNMVLFDDVGLVTNRFLEAAPHDLRNAVGFGLRLHAFLLGRELLTIRFDLAHPTDGSNDTVITWGIGQSF